MITMASDDPWIQKFSSLIPSATAHALGMVGFLWNGCESRLDALYWLASDLAPEKIHGPTTAMKLSEKEKAIRRELARHDAPLQVVSEIEYLLQLYKANLKNRNQLSHYRLRTSETRDAPMHLSGFRLGVSYEFNDSLETIRRVADDIAVLMPYLNAVLIWSLHVMKGSLPAPALPTRPPLPTSLLPALPETPRPRPPASQ